MYKKLEKHLDGSTDVESSSNQDSFLTVVETEHARLMNMLQGTGVDPERLQKKLTLLNEIFTEAQILDKQFKNTYKGKNKKALKRQAELPQRMEGIVRSLREGEGNIDTEIRDTVQRLLKVQEPVKRGSINREAEKEIVPAQEPVQTQELVAVGADVVSDVPPVAAEPSPIQPEEQEEILGATMGDEPITAEAGPVFDAEWMQKILRDKEHTPKEARGFMRDMVNKIMGREEKQKGLLEKAKEKMEWWKSSDAYFINRLQDIDAKAEKIGGLEALFRSLGEKYNKFGLKTKLAVGASLSIGAAASMSFVWLPGIIAACSGIIAQRTAAFATMYLKFEKQAAETGGSKEAAMAKAIGYTAAMTGGTMIAVHYLKEGIDAARDTDIGKNIKGWLGNMLGHHEAVHPVAETPVSGGEMAHAATTTTGAENHAAEAVTKKVAEASVAAPEIKAFAFASNIAVNTGKGYEDMVFRMWHQLHDQATANGINPNKYAERFDQDSDIWKLLKNNDAHSVKGLVHKLAIEHGFFKPDGSSIRIDPGAHMTIDDGGHIVFTPSENGEAFVNASPDLPVTPPLHAEVPVTTAVPSPASVPIIEHSFAHTPTEQPPAPVVEHSFAHTPTEQTPAPIEDHSVSHVSTNPFGIEVPAGAPHLYADAGGMHILAYGGSPLGRAQMIEEYLKQNPNKIIFSSTNEGDLRIPWHLLNGKAIPGSAVRTSGFLGFFSSFMKAPSPEEFKEIIK